MTLMDAFAEILNIKWWQGFLSGVTLTFYMIMVTAYYYKTRR